MSETMIRIIIFLFGVFLGSGAGIWICSAYFTTREQIKETHEFGEAE